MYYWWAPNSGLKAPFVTTIALYSHSWLSREEDKMGDGEVS